MNYEKTNELERCYCTCTECGVKNIVTIPRDYSIVGGLLIKGYCGSCMKWFCNYGEKITEEF